jgi:hypothetical protein
MIGWIIAGVVALALAKKQEAQGAPASGTITTSTSPNGLPWPSPARSGVNVIREPLTNTFQDWQNGPFVPVPTGSRQDVIAQGSAISDAYNNQIVGLRVLQGGGPEVINPVVVAGGNTSVGGGGGASSSSGTGSGSGGSTGGNIGGGGFGGRGGGLK